MRFENNTPIGLIKIKGPLGEKEIEATIDTGAFKSLVSLDLCKELGLHLKEIREVRGVSGRPIEQQFEVMGTKLKIDVFGDCKIYLANTGTKDVPMGCTPVSIQLVSCQLSIVG